MEIEAFRKQLIDANPKTASPTKKQLLSEDLAIAYEALDRITDNLGELINETNDTDELIYYAQIRGELCSHFNGIAMLLEDHNQDISQSLNEVTFDFVLIITQGKHEMPIKS